jgi:hypothetical protein
LETGCSGRRVVKLKRKTRRAKDRASGGSIAPNIASIVVHSAAFARLGGSVRFRSSLRFEWGPSKKIATRLRSLRFSSHGRRSSAAQFRPVVPRVRRPPIRSPTCSSPTKKRKIPNITVRISHARSGASNRDSCSRPPPGRPAKRIEGLGCCGLPGRPNWTPAGGSDSWVRFRSSTRRHLIQAIPTENSVLAIQRSRPLSSTTSIGTGLSALERVW